MPDSRSEVARLGDLGCAHLQTALGLRSRNPMIGGGGVRGPECGGEAEARTRERGVRQQEHT